MTQEREAKRNYKEAFEALTKAKAKMEASATQEEALRRDLIESFDGYFEAKVRGGQPELPGIGTPVRQASNTDFRENTSVSLPRRIANRRGDLCRRELLSSSSGQPFVVGEQPRGPSKATHDNPKTPGSNG